MGYRSQSLNDSGGAGASSITVTRPAGAVSGDILLAFLRNNEDYAGETITAPTGWTLRAGITAVSTGALAVWSAPGDVAALQWTFGATSIGTRIDVVCYSGCDIVESAAMGTAPGSAGTTLAAPSLTAVAASTILVCGFSAREGPAPTQAPPGSMTERTDQNSRAILGISDEAIAAAGATGTRTTTFSASVDSRLAVSVLLRVIVAPPALPQKGRQVNIGVTKSAYVPAVAVTAGWFDYIGLPDYTSGSGNGSIAPAILNSITDTDLDAWAAMGCKGFIFSMGYLSRGMGGSWQWAVGTIPAGNTYNLQRTFVSTNIIARMASRGIKAYLMFRAAAYNNATNFWYTWPDATSWANNVIPAVTDLATFAAGQGFAGMGIDHEDYAGNGGNRGNWSNWDGATYATIKARGAAMMNAVLGVFPGCEWTKYGNFWPTAWAEYAQLIGNGISNAYTSHATTPFWDGMLSVNGYGKVRYFDAIFYKEPNISGATFDQGLKDNAQMIYAYMSRNVSNWDVAASLYEVEPFMWFDSGFDRQIVLTPANASDQVDAFNKWRVGDRLGNFNYRPWFGRPSYTSPVSAVGTDYNVPFDWNAGTPTYAAIRNRISNARTADAAPTVAITTNTRINSTTCTIGGTCTDDMAVRIVRWAVGAAHGTAQLTATRTGTVGGGLTYPLTWTVDLPATAGQTVTITVEDLRGNTVTSSVAAHA